MHQRIVLLRLALYALENDCVMQGLRKPLMGEVSTMLSELGYVKLPTDVRWLAGLKYAAWVRPDLLQAKNSELKIILNETLQPTKYPTAYKNL